MNRLKIFSIAFLTATGLTRAQDLDQAKKAIDAEQYEKAKTILKQIVQAKPSNGRATFLLGNVYLKQGVADSAKIYFDKGISATEAGKLNYIGLGQLELDKGNTAGAQTNFTSALNGIKKKDTEELVAVARAYTNSDKPDYKQALTYLAKAKAANPTDAQVQLALGDAYYKDKNQNDAYTAYRDALMADPTLIRAKMQQGVLLKGARAFNEAVKSLNEVVAANPNYGPVYRELAETYYLWGTAEPKKYTENIQKALTYYEKYMSLTDYSLNSRMRHADFLILAKDYKALEVEAEKMKQLDKVNPRILRYLGYSAYENGNVDVAISSLESFIANPSNKVIARDYLYRGLAKLKKANNAATNTVDQALFTAGVADLKKSVDMEITMSSDLSDTGKKFFSQKMYKEAAAIFEIAMMNPDSRTYNDDSLYYAICVNTVNSKLESGKRDTASLQKANAGLDVIIAKYPTYQDAYYYKARLNSTLDDGVAMVKSYEDYLKAVAANGAEELAKPANKNKLIEAYNTIAANVANSDKAKARDYFTKSLALDPANAYATEGLKNLK
ncbi:MAG: tetratricopeptide repeat protein [Flavobacterium sp.]|nr:MAG: tetratricopeptide repeat protein [Flavobacterium sp.]